MSDRAADNRCRSCGARPGRPHGFTCIGPPRWAAPRGPEPLPLPPAHTGVCRRCGTYAWLDRDRAGVCASCASAEQARAGAGSAAPRGQPRNEPPAAAACCARHGVVLSPLGLCAGCNAAILAGLRAERGAAG
jgi:ribosomal protein L37E